MARGHSRQLRMEWDTLHVGDTQGSQGCCVVGWCSMVGHHLQQQQNWIAFPLKKICSTYTGVNTQMQGIGLDQNVISVTQNISSIK